MASNSGATPVSVVLSELGFYLQSEVAVQAVSMGALVQTWRDALSTERHRLDDLYERFDAAVDRAREIEAQHADSGGEG